MFQKSVTIQHFMILD